jgi:hypothetical protein
MKKLKWGKNVYRLTIYDPVVALERFKNNNITVYSFKKVDDYTYEFKTSSFAHKKVMELFKYVKFVKKEGIYGIIRNLITSKTTIIALIIGVFCLNYFTTLILKVTINGDSKVLVPVIKETLEKYQLKPYQHIVSNTELLEIETQVAKELKEQIEFIQIRKKGSLISVKFLKRRISPIIPKNGENMYAQKDGMIKEFRISSGLIVCKVNQYVKKGDLLVSAYVDTNVGTKEWVGTRGSVYAYTWTQITASVEKSKVKSLTEDEIYLYLLESVHEKLSYQINGNDESIKNEKVLQFTPKESKIILVVHYTLIEDITR